MATGVIVGELVLSSSDELPLTDTDEFCLFDFGTQSPRIAGEPFRGSFTVLDGYRATVEEELVVGAWDEVSIQGDGHIYLTDDFGTRSEIVLQGRG